MPRRFLICSTDSKVITETLGKQFGIATREFSREAINEAQQSFYLAVETLFEEEGEPPHSWAPLRLYTMLERSAMKLFWASVVPGFSDAHPILQRTGRFKRSLMGGSTYHVVQKKISGGSGTLAIGTADPRFKKLHSGGIGTDTGGKVPARPVIPSEDLIQLIDSTNGIFMYVYQRYFRAGLVRE